MTQESGGKISGKILSGKADLVTGVPESGLPAAKGYSERIRNPVWFCVL